MQSGVSSRAWERPPGGTSGTRVALAGRSMRVRVPGGPPDVSCRRQPKVPSSARSSNPRLMIAQDPCAAGRARVMGSLTADTVQILLDAVDSGAVVLDLAQLVQVDDCGVHVLTKLREKRCAFLACPRWLELWLASVRGKADV